jgi:serine/threonine protein phosphatase PrpC
MKSVNVPGLAMTRSFGDKLGAQAGVIAVPEVQEYTIAVEDKFIIIASDGVWEFLSS